MAGHAVAAGWDKPGRNGPPLLSTLPRSDAAAPAVAPGSHRFRRRKPGGPCFTDSSGRAVVVLSVLLVELEKAGRAAAVPRCSASLGQSLPCMPASLPTLSRPCDCILAWRSPDCILAQPDGSLADLVADLPHPVCTVTPLIRPQGLGKGKGVR
jgi:hypothetical protein